MVFSKLQMYKVCKRRRWFMKNLINADGPIFISLCSNIKIIITDLCCWRKNNNEKEETNVKKNLMVFVLSLMFALFTSQAMASVSTATAELLWGSLSYTNATLVESSKNTTVEANTENSVVGLKTATDGGTDWGAYSATKTIAQATATAYTDASKLSATSTAGATGSVLPVSSAYVTREATFTVDATGKVSFTIPYTLSFTAEASTGSMSTSWAEVAKAYYGIYLIRYNGDERYSALSIGDLVFNGDSTSGSSAKAITVELKGFQKGDTGTILFKVGTETSASAVPVPAAVWLFGSGLFGLVGVRRKFSK